MIEKISNLLTGDKTLFLIDDIIADETLDKRRQPLCLPDIANSNKGHSLWLLTQSYRTDLNTIHEENDVIGLEELARVKAQLKWGKHTCLIMRMEHPRAYMIR